MKELEALNQKLNDPAKFTRDLEGCLPYLLTPLSDSGSTDIITGLQAKFKSLSSSRGSQSSPNPWFEPAALASKGRFEKASSKLMPALKQFLENPKGPQEINSLQFGVTQMTQCYISLRDWDALKGWPILLGELKAKYPSLELALDPPFLNTLMTYDLKGGTVFLLSHSLDSLHLFIIILFYFRRSQNRQNHPS